jgi:large exoprotein involved in heme utilization and adhesion
MPTYLEVVGNGFPVFSFLNAQVNVEGTGNAGDINIETEQLSIRNSGQVSTGTFGKGNSGNLFIQARDLVELIGTGKSLEGGYLAVAVSTRDGVVSEGDAGNLTINTQRLVVKSSQVSASVFGKGSGGNLTVRATDSVELSGILAGDDGIDFSSGLFSSVSTEGEGRGGNLTVETNRLSIGNGARAQVATLGQGNAGKLFIRASEIEVFETPSDRYNNLPASISASVLQDPDVSSVPKGNGGSIDILTNRLIVRNGGEVSTRTEGEGNAGNLRIYANESIEVFGVSPNAQFKSEITAATTPKSIGDGGSLNIETGKLIVRDSGTVSVRGEGRGTAGNLNVNADSIRLDNNATLTADTRSVNKDPNKSQANININSQNLILRRGSNITADARGENVIGGNVNINADVLAILENSRISANSTDSRGGRVTIKTQGIFGTQPWYPNAIRGYITATGTTPDLSGDVEITTPDVDPSSGLVELPINLVDASQQISNACTPGTRQFQNTFVATGRGGLPMSPTEPLQDSSTLSAWVRFRPKPENSANTSFSPQPTAVSNTTKVAAAIPIMEATGWIVDSNGNIELVAQAPQVTPHSPWQTPASCQI